MNSDGTGKTQLTDNDYDDFYPTASSDGNQIIFDSGPSGSRDVYTINIDGTNLKQITTDEGDDRYPGFSPVKY